MLNILLFGPPGAGKGTQSLNILKEYGLIHLSTGDILRVEISEKSELGMKAQYFMDKGELVPDKVVIGMIQSKIDYFADSKGFIFDGFPRTVKQAVALDEMLENNTTPISLMISLNVEHDELVKRLKGRAKESGRADDQDNVTIVNRLNIYKNTTMPVKDYYKSQNKLEIINGMGSIEEIFERIKKTINKIVF